jgi:hypothetical protein
MCASRSIVPTFNTAHHLPTTRTCTFFFFQFFVFVGFSSVSAYTSPPSRKANHLDEKIPDDMSCNPPLLTPPTQKRLPPSSSRVPRFTHAQSICSCISTSHSAECLEHMYERRSGSEMLVGVSESDVGGGYAVGRNNEFSHRTRGLRSTTAASSLFRVCVVGPRNVDRRAALVHFLTSQVWPVNVGELGCSGEERWCGAELPDAYKGKGKRKDMTMVSWDGIGVPMEHSTREHLHLTNPTNEQTPRSHSYHIHTNDLSIQTNATLVTQNPLHCM